MARHRSAAFLASNAACGAGERGQVAIVVALTLTVLLGLAALVVDVGLGWAVRARAQSAADAAALAGAAELPNGPAAAIAAARDYINGNVAGLADSPPPNQLWESDGDPANGEIVCWTLPAAAPASGCAPGSTAIQVVTPPIRADYAFASVLGSGSASIKARAAARVSPPVSGPCALCVLDGAGTTLTADGAGSITVTGGDIVVNSPGPPAATLTGSGSITANPPGRIGGPGHATFLVGGAASFNPAPSLLPPAADLLAGFPRCGEPGAPCPPPGPPVDVAVGGQIDPGFYRNITLGSSDVLVLRPGTYVITGRLRMTGSSRLTGTGVTLYLACVGYPAPCAPGTAGGALDLSGTAAIVNLTAPVTGLFRGLTIFSDRENTAELAFSGTSTYVSGTIYARAGTLALTGTTGVVTLDSMVLAGRVVKSGNSQVVVNFDPAANALGGGVTLIG